MSGPQILDRSSPLVGRQLAGRYLVRALLGRGGMGEVYAARDEILERDVAVKLLPAAASEDGRSLARLRREARAAAGLMHHNVVAVHDLVVADGHAFIVMELVPGRSLARILNDETPLLPSVAVRIARDVAEALSYAHGRGMTHRDIAPGNIVVTPEGCAKVLDFGLARAEDWTPAYDASSSPHGTVAYTSPEQLDGRGGDARSDVYSLGCVLYEMLTGRPPFDGPSVAAIAAQHIRAPVVPPSLVRRGVPHDLDRVVLRCLMKEPRARFSSAAELVAALDEPRRSEPSSSTPALRLNGDLSPTPPLQRDVDVWPTAPLGTRAGSLERSPFSSRWRRSAIGAGATIAAVLIAIVVLPIARLLIWPPGPDALPRQPRPLVPPTRVVAHGVCDGFLRSRVDLSWAPGAAVAAAYDVFRRTSVSGEPDLVARVTGHDSTSFEDVALGMGKTYFYMVRSVSGRRVSALTEPVAAHTPLLCLG